MTRRSSTVATIAIVVLAAAVAQGFGRFTYGVVLPDVREDLLDSSNTLAGLLGTTNTFAYLAGTLVVASVGTRMTPVAIMRSGMVLAVSGLVLAVVAPNGAVLAGALFLMGLGGAAIWIPSPGMAASVVSTERRGVAVGLMGAGVGLGVLWSGQLKGIVAGDADAWRDVYLSHAIVGAVVLILVMAVLRVEVGPRSEAGGFGGFRVLARMDGWRALTGCYFAYGFGYLLVIAFLVARLEDDAGYSATSAGRVFTLMGVCTMAGGIVVGRISDVLGRRRTLIGGFLVFAAGALVILQGHIVAVVAGTMACGLLFGGLATVIAAYIVDRTDAATYAPSYAAATFAFGLAQVGAPQVGGAVADLTGSFTVVFVMSAAVMAAGAASATRLPADALRARGRRPASG